MGAYPKRSITTGQRPLAKTFTVPSTEGTFLDLDEDAESDTDSGSEYGLPGQTIKEPPAKRAKTTSTTKPVPSKKNGKTDKRTSKGKANLSLLPTMPLDVLFEIFSNLSPWDIVSLARTTKVFRETLMSKNAATVWKAARARTGTPEGPLWLTEHAWAALIHGNVCHYCGAINIQKFDFMILRRACTNCKKNHLVVKKKFESLFPELDRSILDLVPYTNVGGWAHGHASNSEFYWDTDIERMDKSLNTLEHNIHKRVHGAKAALDAFRLEQLDRRNYLLENHRSWAYWLSEMQFARAKERYAKQNRRMEEIKGRFKGMGYLDQDLRFLDTDDDARGKAAVTDKVWSRLVTILEPKASKARNDRLEYTLKETRLKRCEVVRARYTVYKKTIHPSQWKYLPPLPWVTLLDGFAELIGADGSVMFTPNAIDGLFESFDTVLIQRGEDLRQRLIAALQTVSPSINFRELVPQGAPNASPDGPPANSTLNLATAVFKCGETTSSMISTHFGYLFGEDEVSSHHCPQESLRGLWYYANAGRAGDSSTRQAIFDRPHFESSSRATRAVEKVLQLVALNPATATVADLDNKVGPHDVENSLRFGCVGCTAFKESGQFYRFGFSWRDLVAHIDSSGSHNAEINIFVLDPNQSKDIKTFEIRDAQVERGSKIWACTHCSEHADDLQTQDIVKVHLTQQHAISNPRQDVDYVSLQGYRPYQRHKAKFCVLRPAQAAISSLPKNVLVNMSNNASSSIRGQPISPTSIGVSVSSHNNKANICCLKCSPSSSRRFILQGVISHLRDKHKIQNAQFAIDYKPVN